MEETIPLHAQKVAILSRLMKENSSLTLEESLLLLKDETDEDNQVVDNQSNSPNYLKFNPNTGFVDLQQHLKYPGAIRGNPFFWGTTSSNTTLTSSGTLSEANTNTQDADI